MYIVYNCTLNLSDITSKFIIVVLFVIIDLQRVLNAWYIEMFMIHPFTRFHTYLSFYLSLLLSVCLSVYLPTYPPTHLSIYLSIYGSIALCWTLASFSVSWSFTQSVGLLGRGISPSQGSYLHTGQHKQNKSAQTSMPQGRFEPTIPVFERVKTVHVLDCHCDRPKCIISYHYQTERRRKFFALSLWFYVIVYCDAYTHC
jgi:hypothetical protein